MDVESQFVERVLALKESGQDSPQYDGLVSQIRASDDGLDDEEVNMKSRVLLALGRLGQRLVVADTHATLLNALFACTSKRIVIVRALNAALAAVVSNNATLVGRAFSASLGGLAIHASDLDTSAAVVEGLSTLIDLCPQGTNEFVSNAKKKYPWKGLSVDVHVAYARVLLSLSRHRPLLEPFVLQLVVERALELDAEVDVPALIVAASSARDRDDEDDDEDDRVDEQLFELDLAAATPTTTLPSSSKLGEQLPVEEEEEEEPPVAAKLDSVMCLIFDHVESRRDEDALLESTMAVFESAVLLTHKSRFVQFVVFRVCASNAKRAQYFASKLVRMIAEDSSVLVRRGAVVYLASFVSRATSVDTDLAARCASFFFEWIENHYSLLKEEDDDRSLYYAIFQALLYVLCFRGDDIFEKATFSQNETRRWQTLLKQGNGLAKCHPRVRAEFLQVCDRSNVFPNRFIDDLTKTINALGDDKNSATLRDDDHDFFFPFDPYLLPRSRTYIASTYRDWDTDADNVRGGGGAGAGDDDDGDDDDPSDDDRSEEEQDEDDDDEAPRHMSVSPGILSAHSSQLQQSYSPRTTYLSSYENSVLSFDKKNPLRRPSAQLSAAPDAIRRNRFDSAGSYNSDW